MSTKKVTLILISIFYSFIPFAQESQVVGFMPQLNINYDINPLYALNFQVETRESVYRKSSNIEKTNYESVLQDLSLIGSRKIGLDNKLAAGYLVRIIDDVIVHRSIQQFSMITRGRNLRIAHRIAMDQSFSEITSPRFRIRYRITPEIPLSGTNVDAREVYLKVNNEYLNGLRSGVYELEIRLDPMLGYVITDRNKVEVGPTIRYSSEFNGSIEAGYWFKVGWYLKI